MKGENTNFMSFLARFGKELFWTIVWVFVALIVGYFVLNLLISRNIPLLSNVSSWVERYSQAGQG